MKRERAIEIARKHNVYRSTICVDMVIADAILEAVAEEREECAKAAEQVAFPYGAAKAIRARSGQ